MSETLDELLRRAAADWTQNDLLAIVFSLRKQREEWNTLQAQGSKKRAPASSISVDKTLEELKGIW
jgi:hypothetical protein